MDDNEEGMGREGEGKPFILMVVTGKLSLYKKPKGSLTKDSPVTSTSLYQYLQLVHITQRL